MRTVLGCVIAAMAIFAFGTAIVPRWRRTALWKGTRVRCGPVASLGFGMAFGVTAALTLAGEWIPAQHRIWMLLALIFGIVLIFVGQARDFRERS